MAPKKRIDLQQIVDTAIALADRDGYESVTLLSVATQLGIRNPSLYNHISSLAGLRYEMTLWTVRQVAETMRRAAVGKSGDEAVLSVSNAVRAFALLHPGIYPLVQHASPSDQQDLLTAREEVLEILLAVLAPYGLAQEDNLHAVRAWRSVLHGFIDLEVIGGFGMDLNREESFHRLMQMFLAGLHIRQNGM